MFPFYKKPVCFFLFSLVLIGYNRTGFINNTAKVCNFYPEGKIFHLISYLVSYNHPTFCQHIYPFFFQKNHKIDVLQHSQTPIFSNKVKLTIETQFQHNKLNFHLFQKKTDLSANIENPRNKQTNICNKPVKNTTQNSNKS